jgi:uncharacterized protein
MLAFLGLISLVVGLLIGALGVGGILLIPAIAALAGLDMHAAMATALFTFPFTGLAGTILYHRRGDLDWKLALPICFGAMLFAWLGAMANASANTKGLTLLLGGIILYAGLHILKPVGRYGAIKRDAATPGSRPILVSLGAVVGFGSGLTGVGGPILSIPVMVAMGFDPLATVAAGQVLQIAAAVSGILGNLAFGRVDYGLAAWVTVLEVVGVLLGVRLSHKLGAHRLKPCVAGVCIVLGGVMVAREALSWFVR